MKESSSAAWSLIRSRLDQFGLRDDLLNRRDLHVHIPAGAVPKDGPSAGLAIALSILSTLLQEPVRQDIAVTGEITLTGRVLAVGGIREKVLAAHRAGIRQIVLPAPNRKDECDLPENVRSDLELHYVSHLDEASRLVFVRPARVRPKQQHAANYVC